ncbi:MAG: OB-fold domain-containing protein [Rhodocyclaceae bacterium]|nr:OB-fold domain-containing protein [Rhodocyclaceae bacterium]
MNPTERARPPRCEISPLAEYQTFLARGELGYQVDQDNQALFYPRVGAPVSHRGTLNWKASAGLGTVYATTYISPHGEAPYNVALIDIDEGFRLMSRVESIAPSEVRVGMRVRVRIQPGSGGDDPYPVFDLVETA